MMTKAGIVLAGLLGLMAVAEAQERKLTPISIPHVNSSGYRITAFKAAPSGAGCEGGQSYVGVSNPEDKGFSRMVWAEAQKAEGGVLCTSGQWYYGSGPQVGTPGGRAFDVLIKGGRYFRVSR